MYEIEYKVELTKQEKEAILKSFKEKDFKFLKSTPQRDFYIKAIKSPYYDLNIGAPYEVTRYRDEDGRYIYTEKSWEMIDGNPAQVENEYTVTKEVFETETAKFPEALKIEKTREWFAGSHDGVDISITVDSVKFDHSPEMRYFMEAEISVEDSAKVGETRTRILDFLKEILRKEEIVQAAGMFTMAFEKK